MQSFINSSPTTVDARCNWWGSATGVSGGQYFGPATVAPFLTTSVLTSPCLPIANLGTSALKTVEGNSGTHTVTLTVNLNGASTANAVVGWTTVSGSADAGDYVGGTGTLTFLPGQTSKTITVTIRGDTTLEQNETFSVALRPISGVAMGTSHQTVVIENDEKPTLIATATGTVSEGGNVTYAVRMAQAYYLPLTVTVTSVDGTAHAGTDFPAVSRTFTSVADSAGNWVLPPLPITVDHTTEGAEQFALKFSSPSANNSPLIKTVTIPANNT